MTDSVVKDVQQKSVTLKNGAEIRVPCNGEIWSFIELQSRLLVLANIGNMNGCNQYRNIFCYAKTTGEQLWQVEQPWEWRRVDPEGKKMRKVYVDEVYKYIKIFILMPEGHYDQNQHDTVAFCGGEIYGKIYLKPFRRGIDRIETRTWSHFPKDYAIDIDTGEVELLEVHQPAEKIY